MFEVCDHCRIHLFLLYLPTPYTSGNYSERGHWQWYALSGMQWTIQCTFALYLTFRSSLSEWILLLLCRYKTVKCRIFSHIFTLHWWLRMYLCGIWVRTGNRFFKTTLSSRHCIVKLKGKSMFYFLEFKYLHCKEIIKELCWNDIVSFFPSIIEWGELVLINLDLEQIQLNLISRLLVDQDFLCQLGNWLLSSFGR